MKRRHWWLLPCAIFVLCAATRSVSAQTFSTLVEFDGTNGANPLYEGLTQGVDGNFYGTTAGVVGGMGTVFRVTRKGLLTTVHTFSGTDGATPYAGLLLAPDGNFYGTTSSGGAHGSGTVFKMTSHGVLTTLYDFCSSPNCTDGANPYSALILATNGNFYGTTRQAGDFSCLPPYGCGTVFKITPQGVFTTLHTFENTDGAMPWGALTQSSSSDMLLGATYLGGDHSPDCTSYGCGTIFTMTPKGTLKTLHIFDYTEGAFPSGALIETDTGGLLGTAAYGTPRGDGIVYRVTRRGVLTALHTFNGQDGASSFAALVQGSDGKFYGTTQNGGGLDCNGVFGCGTLFQMTSDGSLTTLHAFDGDDGDFPDGNLLQGTDGVFYGTTRFLGGNAVGYGTVFSLDMGLPPFAAFVRDRAQVGQPCGILGQGFIGALGVSFNGTRADYKVIADTFIEATVPIGSTTGAVTVTTLRSSLTSNKLFHIIPQLLSFDPPSGPPGTQVTITGVSLTQTLGVGFGDRVQSQFTVNSDTSVTATVPQGAKTGKIGIETKGGVAISAGTFEVTE